MSANGESNCRHACREPVSESRTRTPGNCPWHVPRCARLPPRWLRSKRLVTTLPPHMRQTTICEGINASYRLEVRHGGETVAERLVEPGGLRLAGHVLVVARESREA